MSDTTPVELLVSAFRSEQAAEDALSGLLAAKKERLVRIRAAATVRRDQSGKVHIRERGDVGTAGGAGSGAALGAVVGLFGGPIGAALGAGAGALIGGLAARLIDSGIPDQRLRQLGDALTPGSSAIVALIEHRWVDEIRDELARAGGDIMANAITADVAQQLASGRDVAYTAIAGAGEAVTAARITAADAVETIDEAVGKADDADDKAKQEGS